MKNKDLIPVGSIWVDKLDGEIVQILLSTFKDNSINTTFLVLKRSDYVYDPYIVGSIRKINCDLKYMNKNWKQISK